MWNPIRWWRERYRWIYLGHTVTAWTTTYFQSGKTEKFEIVYHYYAWNQDMKKRKVVVGDNDHDITLDVAMKQPSWGKDQVPFLEGGDMWKPITHPVAVKGNLVNFYKGNLKLDEA